MYLEPCLCPESLLLDSIWQARFTAYLGENGLKVVNSHYVDAAGATHRSLSLSLCHVRASSRRAAGQHGRKKRTNVWEILNQRPIL